MKFDTLIDAARQALGTVKSVQATGEMDEDLQRYMKLRPSNFRKMITDVGEEQTLNYIRTMEKKLASHEAGKR